MTSPEDRYADEAPNEPEPLPTLGPPLGEAAPPSPIPEDPYARDDAPLTARPLPVFAAPNEPEDGEPAADAAPRAKVLKARPVSRGAPKPPEPSPALRALQARLKRPAVATSLLNAAIVLIFLALISGNISSNDFWSGLISDSALSVEGLRSVGALAPNSADSWSAGGLRFIRALFLHHGPWSLAFSVMLMLGAGRLVERLSGPFQMLLIFVVGGAAGEVAALWINAWTPSHLYFVGAWPGAFALIGAQGALVRRAKSLAVEGGPPPVRAARGIFGSLIMIWLLGLFRFRETGIDITMMGAIAGGLVSAAAVGAILVRLLPAFVRDPEAEPTGLGGAMASFLLLGLAIVLASGFLNFGPGSPRPARPRPNRPRSNTTPSLVPQKPVPRLQTYRDPKLRFAFEIPYSWEHKRGGDNFAAFGPRFGAEDIYLFTRDRHPFDAADTLVARFMSDARGDFKMEEMAILDEGSFRHSLGEAYCAIYSFRSGSRFASQRIHRCYYIIGEERIFFVLFRKRSGEEDSRFCEEVIASLKVIPGEESEDGSG